MTVKKAFRAFLDAGDLQNAWECLRKEHDIRMVDEFRSAIRSGKVTEASLELYRNSYDLMARESFDDFMLALEWNRPPEQQFWLPRRGKLMKVCNSLQDLWDGRIQELFLSMPPRVGKSTISLFFTLWVILNNPEAANLYTSYSDTVTDVFYDGLLEILNDPFTYRWKEIYPERELVSTNAKAHLLNIDRDKRYASFTARSLYGTLNGACDCSQDGYEIADDLHSGIEEALNRSRLESAWSKVDNNFLPRGKPGTKNLWIGTRWSLYDCIAKRIDLLENDSRYGNRRYRIINVPALNENDESNFEYDFGVGFTTEYYLMRKASFERSDDLASWEAQYMGSPIERTGTVFSPEDLRYYNGVLPEAEADHIFMVVDPAWGGGDYVAGGLFYQYDNDLYLADVVYNNGDKKQTQPLLVNMAMKHGASAMYVEGTKVTSSYADGVKDIFDSKGYKINLQTTTKHWSSQVGKAQRILDRSPDIKDHVIFRQQGERSKEYEKFMLDLFIYKFEGKNKNDDAPDMLAMTIVLKFQGDSKAVIMRRPF